MAGSSLDQIAALVRQLAQIGGKSRGMTIEAEDWNTLVSVVQGILGVDRGQEEGLVQGLQNRFAPVEHEHLGQVGLDWLDAALQSRQGQLGATASTSIRATVAEAGQQVRDVSDQMTRMRSLIDEQQRALDRSLTGEMDRNTRLRDVERRVGSVDELKAGVASLAKEVADGAGKVSEVLTLRQALVDTTGQLVDLQGLSSRVKMVEDLSRNFEGIDGKPVRLKDIELKLRDLSDAAGTGTGLDQRFDTLGSSLEGKLDRRIDEKAQGMDDHVQQTLASSASALREELASKIAHSQADLQSQLDAKLVARDGQVSARLDAMDQSLNARQDQQAKSEEQALTEQAGALRDEMKRTVDAKAADLSSSLRQTLGSDLENMVRSRVAEATSPLSTELKSAQKQIDAALADLPGKVESNTEAAVEALGKRLADAVGQQVAQASRAMAEQIPGLVDKAFEVHSADLDARVAKAIKEQLGDLDGRIAAAVKTATQDLSAEIRGEVASQVAALDLSGQLKGLADDLTKQWRNDISASAAATRASLSENISSSFSSLQGQIALAQKTATNDAVAKAQELTANLQTKLSASIQESGQKLGQSLRSEVSADLNKQLDQRDATLRAEIAKGRDAPSRPTKVTR